MYTLVITLVVYTRNAKFIIRMHVNLVQRASTSLKSLFLSITASKGPEGTARCQRATKKLHRRYPPVDRRKLPTTSRSQVPEAIGRYQVITNDRNNYSILRPHFYKQFRIIFELILFAKLFFFK